MTAFTRLGAGIWDWDPWTRLSMAGRMLWLALYSAPAGRRCVPGLWHGGLPTMAEAARMQPDEARAALDELLQAEIVEYDADRRVLRLCVLPDAGEYPSNGNCIKSWWTKFKTIPACPVRDAHVRTLRWILDEGGVQSGKGVSPHHEAAWLLSFGTVQVPAPRRRGVRRLADSDTSTQAQPSLFAPPAPAAPIPVEPPALPVSLPIVYAGDGGSPQVRSQAVDNSAALHQSNKIRGPETVTGTVTGTNGIPDSGSRILDSFPESGSGEAGVGAGRPTLALVPPYTLADVVHVLTSHGTWDPRFDEGHQDALHGFVHRCLAARVRLADYDALGQFHALAGTKLDARVLLKDPDQALRAVGDASRRLQERADRLATLAEYKAAGFVPS